MKNKKNGNLDFLHNRAKELNQRDTFVFDKKTELSFKEIHDIIINRSDSENEKETTNFYENKNFYQEKYNNENNHNKMNYQNNNFKKNEKTNNYNINYNKNVSTNNNNYNNNNYQQKKQNNFIEKNKEIQNDSFSLDNFDLEEICKIVQNEEIDKIENKFIQTNFTFKNNNFEQNKNFNNINENYNENNRKSSENIHKPDSNFNNGNTNYNSNKTNFYNSNFNYDGKDYNKFYSSNKNNFSNSNNNDENDYNKFNNTNKNNFSNSNYQNFNSSNNNNNNNYPNLNNNTNQNLNSNNNNNNSNYNKNPDKYTNVSNYNINPNQNSYSTFNNYNSENKSNNNSIYNSNSNHYSNSNNNNNNNYISNNNINFSNAYISNSNLNNNLNKNENKKENLNNNINNNINIYNNNHDKNLKNNYNHKLPLEKEHKNYSEAILKDWEGPYEWDEQVKEANIRIFGNKNFRPNQLQIINACLLKKDIFVCIPTGGGKSLTFQVSSIVSEGVTIVIMPLKSLIEDQKSLMTGLGIKILLPDNKTLDSAWQNYNSLFATKEIYSRYKMILITPERISKSQKFNELLKRLYSDNLLERFVIDEAHCLSTWGREFRKDYLELKNIRKNFPDIPVLAITATATNDIREDIINQLGMKNALFFKTSYNRPNLFLEARNKKDITNLEENIFTFINTKYKNQCGIIYCNSVKDCENLTDKLRSKYKLSCDFYHAQIESDERKIFIQNKWKNDEIKVIIATVAFGMGINKNDVRFVIHYSMPKSFECYYQEIGRAGRDSKYSHCLLYYAEKDKKTLEFLLSKNKDLKKPEREANLRLINMILDFCENDVECRRVSTLNYFDEIFDKKKCNKQCDNCIKNSSICFKNFKYDVAKILDLLNYTYSANFKYTQSQLCAFLKGKSNKSSKIKNATNEDIENFKGKLKNLDENCIRRLIRLLIIKKYAYETLVVTEGKQSNVYSEINISRKGIDQLNLFKTIEKYKNYPESNKYINKNENFDLENDYNIEIRGEMEAIYEEIIIENGEVVEEKKQKEKKSKKKKNNKKEDEETNKISYDIISTDLKKKNKKNEIEEIKEIYIEDEDYGKFLDKEKFEKLLENLKKIRVDLLKNENQIIEIDNAMLEDSENKFPRLGLDDIFPITGLRELCRKIPTLEKEFTKDYIFGVGEYCLSKYGKYFRDEILNFVKKYNINKNIAEVLIDVENSSKKKKTTEKINNLRESSMKKKDFEDLIEYKYEENFVNKNNFNNSGIKFIGKSDNLKNSEPFKEINKMEFNSGKKSYDNVEFKYKVTDYETKIFNFNGIYTTNKKNNKDLTRKSNDDINFNILSQLLSSQKIEEDNNNYLDDIIQPEENKILNRNIKNNSDSFQKSEKKIHEISDVYSENKNKKENFFNFPQIESNKNILYDNIIKANNKSNYVENNFDTNVININQIYPNKKISGFNSEANNFIQKKYETYEAYELLEENNYYCSNNFSDDEKVEMEILNSGMKSSDEESKKIKNDYLIQFAKEAKNLLASNSRKSKRNDDSNDLDSEKRKKLNKAEFFKNRAIRKKFNKKKK